MLGSPGLSLSSQVRTGVVNGPPNNQIENDVSWTDSATGNGWRVGVVPGYGGANVSFWYEISGGVVGPTQSSLNTSSAGSVIEDFTVHPNGTYVGGQTTSFAVQELAPIGSSFRRGYLGRTPASGGVNSNGLQQLITTYIYPGDPGFLVERLDITNPGTTAIILSRGTSIELDFLAQLQQNNTTWSTANTGYGYVGQPGPEGTWPMANLNGDPDYYFALPAPGSGVRDGLLTVRGTPAQQLGVAAPYFVAMQNTHRLKVKWAADLPQIEPHQTISMYVLQALRRDLTASEVASIAADYLNPGIPAMIQGAFLGFDRNEGVYQIEAGGGATVSFTPSVSAAVPTRWLNIYRITGWSGSAPTTVSVGGTTLTSGSDYVWLLDASAQTLYVKLMRPVSAGATPGSLPAETITIAG
jgi:hypothetical protein